VAGSPSDEAKAFNKTIIEELRASEGRVSGFSARPIPRIDVEMDTRAFTVPAEELDDRPRRAVAETGGRRCRPR
jgi:hypothetical protein